MALPFKSLRRIVPYLKPYRRLIAINLLLIIGLATTYSFSIASLLPMLKVLISEEGLHGWLDKVVAEDRLGVKLTIGAASGPADAAPPAVPQLMVEKAAKSPKLPLLAQKRTAAKVPLLQGDLISAVNGRRANAYEIIRQIASSPRGMELTLSVQRIVSGRLKQIQLQVRLADASLLKQYARKAASLLPPGRTVSQRFATLATIVGGLLLLTLMGAVLRFAHEYLVALLSQRVVMDIRTDMYDRIIHMPLSKVMQRGVDDISARLVIDCRAITNGTKAIFGKAIREPTKAVFVLAFAFLADWRLTLLVVVATPIGLTLLRKFGKWIRRASKRAMAAQAETLGKLEESLRALRLIKAYTAEPQQRKRFFQVRRNLLSLILKVERIDAATNPTLEVLGFLGAAAVILIAGKMVFARTMSPDLFLMMIACWVAVADSVRKLSNVNRRLQQASAASERVFELIDTPPESEPRGAIELPPLSRQIELRNVTYSYPNTDRPALRNINLLVPCGKTAALVGPNGAGKTTLISLLLRFFDPDEGQVLFDGVDLRRVKLRSLRKQIGLVPQEEVVFSETVRANIAYGARRVSEERVIEAAKAAHAHEFIMQLPQGYDTMLGKNGMALSGGQLQRLAIARAILRNPRILILDEATSQVDSESEAKIKQALRGLMKGRTTFVIAHRLSTILSADMIVVMEAGSIIAVGNHDQLLSGCDLYRRLYETQFRQAG